MKRFFLIPFLLLFIVSGCQQPFTFHEHTAQAGEKGIQVIFLYDQSVTDGTVNNYFDALLDAIHQSSLHRQQITVHTGDTKNLADRYHLDDCPALIVKNNGVTQARIEGQKNRQVILKELNQIIPQENRSSH